MAKKPHCPNIFCPKFNLCKDHQENRPQKSIAYPPVEACPLLKMFLECYKPSQVVVKKWGQN